MVLSVGGCAQNKHLERYWLLAHRPTFTGDWASFAEESTIRLLLIPSRKSKRQDWDSFGRADSLDPDITNAFRDLTLEAFPETLL